jgi:hypothetical protein
MMPRISLRNLAVLIGLVAIACGSLAAAGSIVTWGLFEAYFLTLLTPLRRYSLLGCPLAVALAVVAFSASGADPISTCLVAVVGFAACAAAMPSIPSAATGDATPDTLPSGPRPWPASPRWP